VGGGSRNWVDQSSLRRGGCSKTVGCRGGVGGIACRRPSVGNARGLSPCASEGSLELTSSQLRLLLRLRSVDALSRDPLPQHNEGVTDLFIGAPNRDVASHVGYMK